MTMRQIASRHQYNHAGQLVGPGAFLSAHGQPLAVASPEPAATVPAPDNGERVEDLRARIADLTAEIADQQAMRESFAHLESRVEDMARAANTNRERDKRLAASVGITDGAVFVMDEVEELLVAAVSERDTLRAGAEVGGARIEELEQQLAQVTAERDAAIAASAAATTNPEGTGEGGEPPPPAEGTDAKPTGESGDKPAGGNAKKRT